ncbi:MAG: glycosyltransferase [Dehalococcoidales bacterium]|nr:MAG: glycosyltransferase [Dehalococcoidales bacterium]
MNKKMTGKTKRVCIVRHAYYPEKPPTKRDAETLVAHGYEVDVICLRDRGEKSREVLNGVNLYRLPVEHRRTGALRYAFEYIAFPILASLKLTWLYLRKRYQVIEVNAMPEFLVFSTLLPRLLGAMVTLNLLDHSPIVVMQKFKVGRNHLLVRLLRLLEKVSFRYVHHIILHFQISQQGLKEWGIPASKATVVLNVPDEEIFNADAPLPVERENNHFQIITHGSLLEQYGVQILIQAVPLLIPHIPELKVEIVGDGEYRTHLEQLVKDLGLEKYVRFTGFVPMEKIPYHIYQADVGVISILISMVPNKLFEYIALSTPVVSSDFPAIHACFDNDKVMYFETGNEKDLARCILELYGEPTKRTTLRTSALAAYQQYRWKTQQYKYLKVFEQLMNYEDNQSDVVEEDKKINNRGRYVR